MRTERWRRLFIPSRRKVASDIDDEFRFHVEMLAQELVATGADPRAARAEAERRFGAVAPVRDECLTIDQRRARMLALEDIMNIVAQDIRYVGRTLRASRGFSLVVTLTLAIGIGVTTALFSVVDTVLLRPLPYRDPAGLVGLFDVQGREQGIPVSYQEFQAWAKGSSSALSAIGASFGTGEVLSGSGDAEQLSGARVSSSLPPMLGITPVIGRAFRSDEDAAGAAPVVMLSDALWNSHFHSDPALIGHTIILTGKPYVVVGIFASDPRAVLPMKWSFASGKPNDFLLPLRLNDTESPPGQHWLAVVGRARPGVSVAQAKQRLDAMARALNASGSTTHGIDVEPLDAALVGNVRTPLVILLSAVGLLLIVACANVANLLLARGASRQRELAVRSAIGAGRRRIAALVLLESVVLALSGGAGGIVLAYGLVRIARAELTATVPRILEVSIDTRILIASILVSVAVGIVVGLVPALQTSRIDPARTLRDGGRGSAGGIARDGARRTLVVLEISLSFMLLLTGALLSRSFVNLVSVPKGFDPAGVMSGRTWLPSTRYPSTQSQIAFWDRFERRVAEETGDTSVTLTSALPAEGGLYGDVVIEGRPSSDADNPTAEKRVVGGNYFALLRAPMVGGRSFAAADGSSAPPVVVVNEAFAKRWMPGANAIGKRISIALGKPVYRTIIGIVSDVREGPLGDPPKPAVYTPVTQSGSSFMNVALRTDRPEAEVAGAFRRALRSIDPALPLLDVRRASDVMLSSVRQQKLEATLLATFAVVALLLAGVGLYAVVSYSVAQRTQEFGIRAALGAQRGDLMRLVLGESFAFAGTGLLVGVAGSIISARLITSQLFGIAALDPLTFLLVGAVMGAIVVLAGAVPTMRASRADPLEAIRGV